ncbi:MAG TPA: D-alanyl-D-alanine carboxypeptidase/D-alanyl-D-alanine-endopeptidase [Verrucomicrobiae bacterium]|jgi:D-alanyl-D-alanine carboxypeptidase/D-alanyl-D-alanine-endopeptidase (penicillin-binding protein 4)
MKRRAILALLCAALAFRCAAEGGLPELQARVAAILDEPQFARAQWGVKVVAIESGVTLFERNAGKLMHPASNAKLYTAALALDRLGPDYRIKSSFYAGAKPDAEGIVHGDLLVYGRGDPSFSARFNGGDYEKAMQPALDALLSAGVKKIDGALIGDASYFRGPPFGGHWTWGDLQEYYGAPASALTFQDNVIDLVFKPGHAEGDPCVIATMPETGAVSFVNRTRTAAAGARGHIRIYRPLGQSEAYVWGDVPLGASVKGESVSVPKPALWFVEMLKEGLARRGVAATGQTREEDWLSREASSVNLTNLVEIASVESRPLAEIVKQTLKPSENLYAQLLLLQVGAQFPSSGRDTEHAGLAEMQKFLESAGLARGEAQLDEGSGLSRACLVTPDATVRLLVFMNRHRTRNSFVDALPIAGVDGTLRNRFKGTVAAGNLRAKTGSLEGVDSLSGYVTAAGGEKLAFSLMLNNDPGETIGRAALDKVALQLAEFSGQSSSR